jgi:hypothetical protein
VARRPDLRGTRLAKVRLPRPIQGLDRKIAASSKAKKAKKTKVKKRKA